MEKEGQMDAESSTETRSFGQDFERVTALIREEWPAVDKAALEATNGDFDGVLALVATTTEHTRALVRRQLEELRREAHQPNDSGFLPSEWNDILRRVQGRAGGVARDLKSHALEEATLQVRRNPLTSLLVALGLGFLLGLALRRSSPRG